MAGNPLLGSGPGQRAALAALEAGLVIGVLYFLGHRDWLFMGSIAGAIALAALSPPRYSGIVSGICMFALAAFFHLHYNWTKIPIVLGGLGLVFLVMGVLRLKTPRRD